MNPEQARTIAESFLSTQEMRGYKAVFVEARARPRWPNEIAVVFDIFSSTGGLLDGPMIVIVDKATKEARLC